jgi:hypothetical protein
MKIGDTPLTIPPNEDNFMVMNFHKVNVENARLRVEVVELRAENAVLRSNARGRKFEG